MDNPFNYEKLLQGWAAGIQLNDEEWEPTTVTCINCTKEWDEREVFVTMGIVYCPVCVVYVLRNRVTSEQRDDIVNELQTYSMPRAIKGIPNEP